MKNKILFITTDSCSLCSLGRVKVENIFGSFIEIDTIDVLEYDQNLVFRVPIVVYKNNVLDEGKISSFRLIVRFVRYLIF
jgi:hypothetical protein|tara:strand:+ start:658 stop:897 length:240 start_codon:yes stop_codon:yes gene_type:complete